MTITGQGYTNPGSNLSGLMGFSVEMKAEKIQY